MSPNYLRDNRRMNSANSQRLKHLHVRRNQLETDIEMHKRTLRDLEKEVSHKQAQLRSVEQQIDEIQNMRPMVSEHAMLRYLERVKGIDLKEIEKEILSDSVSDTIETISSGRIPISKDMELIVRKKTVVTVNPKGTEEDK